MSSETHKLIFPQASVLKPRSDLKMYQNKENIAKKTRGKRILKQLGKTSSKLKCESWLNLFNEESDDQKSNPKPINKEIEKITHKNKSSIVITKRKPVLSDLTNEETNHIEKFKEISDKKHKNSLKSHDVYEKIDENEDGNLVLSPEFIGSLNYLLAIYFKIYSKINLLFLETKKSIFRKNHQRSSTLKPKKVDSESDSDSETIKKPKLIRRARPTKIDPKRLEQDNLLYEEWCKEYEEVKSYKLIVETVDHDF